MRIAVFGAGGVGGYFGGRLAQSGEDVVFIARGAHLNAMQQNGLRVKSIKGDFTVNPVQVTGDPAQAGQADVVLLAVKTWQVPEAAESMRAMLGSDTFVVPLLNGVEAPAQLAAALGQERVLGGLCRISTLLAAPGEIHHVGIEPYIAFGELNGSLSWRAERLGAAFENAGVAVETPSDIQAAMWAKFLFIASISGVGAVARAPLGVLRSLPETRLMLEQAMREVLAVAQMRKVGLGDDAVAKTLATIDSLAPGVMGSMARDIIEARPSELESQSGAVVRLGAEAGVPTPVHAYLYASLLPQERRARGEIAWGG